jgi:hypothetical protein
MMRPQMNGKARILSHTKDAKPVDSEGERLELAMALSVSTSIIIIVP